MGLFLWNENFTEMKALYLTHVVHYKQSKMSAFSLRQKTVFEAFPETRAYIKHVLNNWN